MTIIPMVFMFAVTLTALVLLTINFFKAKNYVLFVIAILLFIFAIELIVETYKVLSSAKASKETDVKA